MFIATVSHGNPSQDSGSRFKVMGKEGIRDRSLLEKCPFFQNFTKSESAFGSPICGNKKVDMFCKMHILFAN
jgi:hypothetical protein